MSFETALRCRECGREYDLAPIFSCEFCFGPLEVAYDYDGIRDALSRDIIEAGPSTLWRYAPLLPCDPEFKVDLGTGYTPLIRADRLAKAIGLDTLWIKNDTVNPTWSFKDRVVSVAIARARQFGFTAMACASTGNLANSVSAHAASAGMPAYVFIPHDLEEGKVVGSSIYNPTLVMVDGSYDDVNRLCSEVAGTRDWAFVNINVRPYYAEGSRTLAYEVAEEFHKVGLIDAPHTRMSGAQARGCSPITTAFENDTFNFVPQKPNTIARSLAIGNPADGYYALKVMEETSGGSDAATDDEIVEGVKLLAETEGVFAETAGGVTIACLKRMVASGAIRRDEETVAFITGGGLKTIEAVQGKLNAPLRVTANQASFDEALAQRDAVGVASGGK
jgi:threonine synthase